MSISLDHRRVILAVAGALMLGALAVIFAAKVRDKMPDFEVYWRAAVRVQAAEPLYRAEDGHFQFKYLPAFAILTMPIGALPLVHAKALWFVLSVGLLVVVLALSVRLMPQPLRPAPLLIGATFVVMAKFYGHELVLGQVNVLLAATVLLAAWQMRARREAVAGALLAAAVAVKPYAIIFLPYLAGRRRMASLAAMCGGLVVVLLLPAPWYGIEKTFELLAGWYRTVTESTEGNLTNQDNVSLAAMYAKWLGPGRIASTATLATTLLLLIVAAAALRRRREVQFPEFLEISLLLTLIPLVSPQGWDYVFLVSTPAIMCLVNYWSRLGVPGRVLGGAAMFTIAFSLYDLMGRRAYSSFMSLSIITVCFLIVVWALASLRARAIA